MLTRGRLQIAESVTIDASALPHGVIIDASGNDSTPGIRDGKGSQVSYFGGRDLMSKQGTLNLIGLTLTGADTYSDGGAINTSGNLLVRGCTITGNSGGSGGGINVYSRADVTVLIENTTISNNFAQGLDGGGLYLVANNGHIEVSNSYIVDDHARDRGAGIFADLRNAGSVQIENSVVADNGVDLVYYDGQEGGGIYATIAGPGFFAVVNSKISGNTLTGQTVIGGGGVSIHNSGGTARIESALIQDNHALTTSVLNPENGDGGGIRIDNSKASAFTISNSTIAGNSATGQGGGVFLSESQDAVGVTLSNCTISGNTANRDGGGIAITTANSGSATLSIAQSTIVNNTSDANHNGSGAGGGIFIFGNHFSPVLNGSIVAGNIDRTGVAPQIRDNPNGNPIAVQFSQVGGDPKLGPLVNNGGPTFLDGSRMLTMAPLPGSPAINAGDPSAVAGVGTVPANDGARAVWAGREWRWNWRRAD